MEGLQGQPADIPKIRKVKGCDMLLWYPPLHQKVTGYKATLVLAMGFGTHVFAPECNKKPGTIYAPGLLAEESK